MEEILLDRSAQSCLTLCDPMDCSPPGSFCSWDFSGWNAGVGCHFLLQGIFQTQESNLPLLHCKFFTAEPSREPSLSSILNANLKTYVLSWPEEKAGSLNRSMSMCLFHSKDCRPALYVWLQKREWMGCSPYNMIIKKSKGPLGLRVDSERETIVGTRVLFKNTDWIWLIKRGLLFWTSVSQICHFCGLLKAEELTEVSSSSDWRV